MLHSRFVLAATLLFLWGCDVTESPSSQATASARETASPAETAARFLQAVQTADSAVFRALLSEAAREALAEGDGFVLDGYRVDPSDVGGERVLGERAEVSVSVLRADERHAADLLLKREHGLWRVCGLSVASAEGPLSFDFEAPRDVIGEQFGQQMARQLETAFANLETGSEQGGTAEELAAERMEFEALQPVSVAEFEAGWRIDAEAKGRSAESLIAEWLAPDGLKLVAGEHSNALSSAVDLTLEQVSRIEAVEKVAAAVGLYPIWPELRRVELDDVPTEEVRFERGTRPFPTSLAGPFLIEITELREDAPRPTGLLELTIRALGLDPRVMAYQTELAEVLSLSRASGPAEESLVEASVQHWGTPAGHRGYFTYSVRRELEGLLRGVTQIDTIKGLVSLPLPVEIEALQLKAENEVRDVSVGRLTSGVWSEEVRFGIEGPENALARLGVRSSPLSESGAPLGVLFQGADSWGGKLQAQVECSEAPSVLDVKLCKEVLVSFEFKLAGVPLARFALQPERLESLEFDGSSPVEVDLLGEIQRTPVRAEVALRLRNASNKDATSVTIEFFYHDVKGELLGQFPHTLNGDYDFELDVAGSLVSAGQSVERITSAAFLPEEAVRVRFELRQVEFPDGTTWSSGR